MGIVLKKESCNACDGTGRLGFQQEVCWFCDGTGEIHPDFNIKMTTMRN